MKTKHYSTDIKFYVVNRNKSDSLQSLHNTLLKMFTDPVNPITGLSELEKYFDVSSENTAKADGEIGYVGGIKDTDDRLEFTVWIEAEEAINTNKVTSSENLTHIRVMRNILKNYTDVSMSYVQLFA